MTQFNFKNMVSLINYFTYAIIAQQFCHAVTRLYVWVIRVSQIHSSRSSYTFRATTYTVISYSILVVLIVIRISYVSMCVIL